jgi:hypothetical protein
MEVTSGGLPKFLGCVPEKRRDFARNDKLENAEVEVRAKKSKEGLA